MRAAREGRGPAGRWHPGGRPGLTFAEYLVIASLILGGLYVMLAWRPWEAWEGWHPPGGPPQGRAAAETRAQPPALKGRGRVYFVPLGSFPPDALERLVAHYRDRYGMSIEVQAEVPVDRAAFDERRRQLVAEALIAAMKRHHATLAKDPEAILIGITRGDIYIQQYTWRFAFAYRDDGRFAVVSTARMDPANFGLPAAPAILELRLRKILTKQIGIMHFGLPQGSDRGSVMYGPILGLDDLDSIGEDF